MQNSHKIALALASFSGSLLAQAPANDDCVNATPIILGQSIPFDTTNATINPSDPAWTCAASNSPDIWFVCSPSCPGDITASTCGSAYDSAMSVYDGSGGCGALTLVACRDDSCGLQQQITWTPTPGVPYYIRIAGFSTATGTGVVSLNCDFHIQVHGVAEATPLSGTLSATPGTFSGGDFLRWNFSDPNSNYTGLLAAVAFNMGGPGLPTGLTVQIPGFTQLWAGSTPAGFGIPVGPFAIGAPDFSLQIPPGLFANGDKIRIQGLVLDPANAPGSLPVVPTTNSATFVSYDTSACVLFEDVESAVRPALPTGWTNGATQIWRSDNLGTPSSATGPTSGFGGSVNYLYCETSITHPGTFSLRSPVIPSTGLSALEFALSRIGATIATLEVRLGDGSGTFPTLLATYAGPDPSQSQGGTEWSLEVVPLGAGLPANIQIEFLYSGTTSFTGDIALDNICIK